MTQTYCPYIDVKFVDKLDDRVNFIIKCDNQAQLQILMDSLGVTKKSVTYADIANKLIENS